MKPLTKAILFTRVVHERKTHMWATAVFSNAQAAKQYAVFLHLAHQHGDAATAKSLDPKTVTDADGALVKGAKFAVQVVPYAPAPDAGVTAGFEIEEPVTV